VELNEGGDRTFKMIAGKKMAKTRIFFLWQWGWVQIRNCGRDLGRAKGWF